MENKTESANEKKKVGKLHYLGPGIVAGSSGNDTGGIATYSSVGAAFGYKLLWLMTISTPMLVVVHDMCARIATKTKKGIGSMIRKLYGARVALLLIAALFISNVLIVAANVAGTSVALELITGLDYRIFVIPLTLFIWFVIVKGTYAKVEKVLLAFSFILLSYVIVAFISNPSLVDTLMGTFIPYVEFSAEFFYIAVGTIGATVSPYIYYYYTAAEIESAKTPRQIKEARLGAQVGALWCGIVAYFIILATAATLYTAGIHDIETAKDAALALRPLAGDFTFILFAIGLFGASMIATAVLPLATAYATAETFGLESGVDKTFSEAKAFYIVFTTSLMLGAFLILIGLDPIDTAVLSMVIAGFTTPVLVYLLMKMCNDKTILGEYTNGKITNAVGWLTVGVSLSLVLLMIGSFILGI
jgi:NRAMP (natural resistance-associated macrophage protein)-like metal ion transporter